MRRAMDFDLNVVHQDEGRDEEPELKEEDEEEDDEEEEEEVAEAEAQEGGAGGAGGAEGAAGGGGSGAGAGASGSRRGRGWSVEEDSMLTRLVAAFGPGNWNAMSKMIPGRTGKSCRFRWVNHLDPSVKRGPFSDEEDRVILTAHQIHGNKWKSISKMLPGRTGYAVKNHWNVSLKNKQADQRSPDLSASDMTAAQILSEMKAFTQKALSFGDVVTSGNQEEGEGGDYHGHQNYEDQAFQAKEGCVAAGTRENPPVLRPKASYGAFSVYYPPSGGPGNNSGASTVVPLQGPLAQALGSEFGIHHFLEDAHGEPLIPHQCGYGCCSGQNGPNGGSSLLGPEFIDYIESPSSSQELMSLAAELNEIAWAQCDLPSDPGPSDLPADVSTGMLSMEMRQPTRPSENKNDPCGKLKGVKQ